MRASCEAVLADDAAGVLEAHKYLILGTGLEEHGRDRLAQGGDAGGLDVAVKVDDEEAPLALLEGVPLLLLVTALPLQ